MEEQTKPTMVVLFEKNEMYLLKTNSYIRT
jgi:hypothetical protein